MIRALFLFLLASTLVGCTLSPQSVEYTDQSPVLDLDNFFDGKVSAWGIVQNRKGQVTQRFKVTIDGYIEQETLVLDEHFSYLQGEGMERRVWRINKSSAMELVGEASDIVGKAKGKLNGNSLNWRYQMDLTISSGTFRVTFDDWMWMVDEQTLFNRAYIKKWGIVFGEVTLFMQKTP